jgi:hypothetical protein
LARLQVETAKQTKVHEIRTLVHSTHHRRPKVETTILRIIHGGDNLCERTAYDPLAAVGSNGRIGNLNKKQAMDPVFATMLDTVRIATFLPRAARAENRRFAQEPERGSTDVATAHESARSNHHAVAPGPMRLRKWLVLSFMPRVDRVRRSAAQGQTQPIKQFSE